MRKPTCPLIALLFVVSAASAAWGIENYHAAIKQITDVKGIIDDPAPFYTDSQFYKIFIPDDVWKMVTFDPEASRCRTAQDRR